MGTVAVIGGTGFLGRYVASALRGAGWEVRPLSRRIGCDARRIDPEAIRGCDAVVNLAGIKREAGEQTFQAVHVDLVARLVEAMKTAGVRRLVHISVVVARPAPELPYHDTKWKGEEIVRSSGLDWTILRPGPIYGSGDDLLSHLSAMINVAPVFPIVNDGSAPMMPVYAGDVAAGVVGALKNGASAGMTFDLVGPDRMTLRDVVTRVAEALGRPIRIWSTPVALMKLPVRIMEATMAQPLSTRPQLAMLVEGLAGDPAPARAELGVEPAPFTAERLRPMVDAHRLRKEISAPVGLGLYLLACVLLAFAFRGPLAPWKGMTAAMGVLLAGSLPVDAVRSRMVPTVRRLALGVAAGVVLFGLTRLGVMILRPLWPAWEDHARMLSAWKTGYSMPFLLPTLVLIIVAEETLWRGVVSRFFQERLGHAAGIVAGALFYAGAHLMTMNPLLIGAAVGCGLFWGLLCAATDDLTAPIASHVVWDVLVMFVFPLV
jgi:NADH dehydrogenase